MKRLCSKCGAELTILNTTKILLTRTLHTGRCRSCQQKSRRAKKGNKPFQRLSGSGGERWTSSQSLHSGIEKWSKHAAFTDCLVSNRGGLIRFFATAKIPAEQKRRDFLRNYNKARVDAIQESLKPKHLPA